MINLTNLDKKLKIVIDHDQSKINQKLEKLNKK